MDYEFAEWALEYHKKEEDIARRFKEFSAEQRQKINERKKMKSYKFKCKPKDFDKKRVIEECTGDRMDWFVYQFDDEWSRIFIHKRILDRFKNLNLSFCNEKLGQDWGFMHSGKYKWRSSVRSAKELTEEFVKLLDDTEKVEYTVYHG